jgi:hypothetical protein
MHENQGVEGERGVEGQGLESSAVVFKSSPAVPEPVKPGFAPFDSCVEDDDVVYPVPDAQPVLLTLSSKFNTRPFLFQGSVSKAPATILVDSGASASFASLQWCRKHHIVPKPLHLSGRLADQSSFVIMGELNRCSLKLKGFRTSFEFLVADLPGLDVVLGLDFLEKYDPDLRWKKRSMKLKDPRPEVDNVYTIPAISRESLPDIQTDLIELCTMRDFADMCAQKEVSEDDVFIGFLRCSDKEPTTSEDEFLLAGKGADHPKVTAVLSEYSDVLVSKLPPGDPPQRLGVDGKPLEHMCTLVNSWSTPSRLRHSLVDLLLKRMPSL